MRMCARLYSATAIGLVFAFMVSPAMAQDASPPPQPQATPATAAEPALEGVGDIVVTATRRSESMQKVPIAISAIGGEALRDKGVLDTSALAGQVPNFQVSSPFGKTQPNFILRGVSVANEFNANQASPNGVYLDEDYLSARFAQGMNLYDLERVEVVKGPQGTLYGRNTVGGAINIITRKAALEPFNGFVEAGYGNFNRWHVTGAAGGTLVDDVLAARIAGTIERGDGQEPNGVAGQPAGRSIRNYAVRGSIFLKVSDRVNFTLRGYKGETNPTSEQAYAIGSGPGGANAITGYKRPATMDFWQTDANYVGRNRAAAEGMALISQIGVGTLDITSVTAYDSGLMRVDQDPDGSPVDVFRINWNSDYKQFNQDLRIATDASRPFRVIVGAYYGWDQSKTHNRYTFFNFLNGVPGTPAFDPPNIFVAPPYPGLFSGVPGVFSGFAAQHNFTQSRTSKAIYGEANWDIVPKLTLTAGLRYTWDSLKLRDVSSTALDYNGVARFNFIPFLAAPGSTCPDTPGCPSLDSRSSKLTGRAILSYKPTNTLMFYTSYSKGYRAGAINGTAYASPTQLTFVEPEEVTAYEGGFKSTFLNHRIRLNGAFFYYDYKNQQLQEIIGVVPFLRNAPKARAYGIDLDMSAVITPDVTLNWGFGYLDSKYQQLTLSGVNLDGNKFSNAPDLTFNADLDLRLFRLGDGEFHLRPNAVFTGNTWFSPFNGKNANQNLQQPAYWLANLQAEYRTGNLAVTGYVRNLFAKTYFTYGLDLRASIGNDFLIRGERRTYGVNVSYKF
jgi:iron complex outermembrane receptor protein